MSHSVSLKNSYLDNESPGTRYGMLQETAAFLRKNHFKQCIVEYLQFDLCLIVLCFYQDKDKLLCRQLFVRSIYTDDGYQRAEQHDNLIQSTIYNLSLMCNVLSL